MSQAKPEIEQAKLFLNKAWSLNGKNADSAYYYLKKIDILTRQFPNSLERCRYFFTLGNFYKFNKKFDDAEKAYAEMFKIATYLNNDSKIKSSLYVWAAVKVEKGEFLDAANIYFSLEDLLLKDIKKGGDKATNLSNRTLLLLLYNNLAMIFQTLENKTKNIYCLQKMGPLVETKYDSFLYTFALSTYSLSESHHKYYKPALGLAMALKDTFAIKEIYSEMAYWNVKKEFYKSAWQYANRSLMIKLKMPDDWKYDLLNYYTIGISYLNAGKLDKAEYFLKKAHQGFKENGQLDYQFKVLFDLSKLYKKKHNFQDAFVSFTLGQSIKDSLIGIEQQNRIYQLNADNQESIHQKQMDAKNTEKKYILFLLLSVLIFFALLSYNLLRKNKVNFDLKQNKIKLERKSNLLNESNATKDKLFAIISHDLREPINNLTSYLYLLEDNYAPPKDYLSKLRFNIENAQTILNNLFDWAETQIKNSPTTIRQIEIENKLTKVIQQFENRILEKEILIKMDLKGIMVHADRNYLQIILRNILSNAVKFSEKKGLIEIDHQIEDSHSVIIIRDYGVGISQEQLAKVLNYPSPKTGTNNEKGLGLGLTLCKELVEKQGGKLSIASHIGKGTAVSLKLPFHASFEY